MMHRAVVREIGAFAKNGLLNFNYGGVVVRASDRRDVVATIAINPPPPVHRNLPFEAECRRQLESQGLVELDCLEDYGRLLAHGDYLVDFDGDLNALANALRDATSIERIDRLKSASHTVLNEWRTRGDPVAGLKRALIDFKVLP